MAKRKLRHAKTYDLDIVIPVYGRADLLKTCLDSIEATRGAINLNVVIVDDEGPGQDELKEVYNSVDKYSYPVKVVYNKVNLGFAKTVNNGVRLGTSPLILALNTDIELLPDALQNMIAEFALPDVGVVAPKLLFPNSSVNPHRPAEKVQHAGLYVDFHGDILHAGIGWDRDNAAVNIRRECQAVTGACMMFRRVVVKDVLKYYKANNDPTSGVFNDVYGRGTYEDVEFCFAARVSQWKVIYTPEAEAYHHVGASVKDVEAGYPVGRNQMIFRARCGGMMFWDEPDFL